MNKTIFKKIFVVATVAIIITSFLSCHPDSPDEFIDYVYDSGNEWNGGNEWGGVLKIKMKPTGRIHLPHLNNYGLEAAILTIRIS